MRPRINDRLARATQFPITLISAPAGFGKSVALRDFLLTARVDAIRYDVRREDDTLASFARRLSQAIEPVAPTAAASFPSLQQRLMESPSPERLACSWFEEHFRRTVCTIVIDDLHYAAADPSAIAFLSALIERTSERIKWILASRSDANLPVASWLAYGRMDLPVDENDLRFTVEEALAAADETQPASDPGEVRKLLELTEGWPVAVAIALRTQTHASDLRPGVTREMIYRYLAEQVFASLTALQRYFLLTTSVFSSFDVDVAFQLGGTVDFLGDLRRGVSFVSEVSPGVYRYHDLFRDFLIAELQRAGEEAWHEALRNGARMLEERENFSAALALRARARDGEGVLAILERSGFHLFERGHAELLEQALDAIPEPVARGHAVTLGLRATLDAARGHFDLARSGFTEAIDRAGDPALRASLVHRYAIELVRHDLDCIELVRPYALDDRLAPALRVPLLGTLATSLLHQDASDEALTTIGRALELLDADCDDDLRARVYQQAAYVYRFEPGRERARRYANLAVETALRRNLYEVAARAYSVLYQLAYDEGDDPIACLAIIDKLLECGRKSASTQTKLFGLLAAYGVESERGDDAAIERLDSELEGLPDVLPRVRREVLLAARAMQLAWRGQFAAAYSLLDGTAQRQTDDERRAARAAEAGFYAFAAGLVVEGEAALAEATAALSRCTRPTRRALRARMTIAFAELARGHTAAAHRQISEVERSLEPSMRWLRALAHVGRTIYRVALGQAEPAVLAGALERLRAEHFGGIARLLEAVPFPQSAQGAYVSLTPAEREILELLATGASTKDVAAKTARSPRTVDTHIRSICQKLHCNGRREAVALATGSGWVKT